MDGTMKIPQEFQARIRGGRVGAAACAGSAAHAAAKCRIGALAAAPTAGGCRRRKRLAGSCARATARDEARRQLPPHLAKAA